LPNDCSNDPLRRRDGLKKRLFPAGHLVSFFKKASLDDPPEYRRGIFFRYHTGSDGSRTTSHGPGNGSIV
jgi:hypothetical protein